MESQSQEEDVVVGIQSGPPYFRYNSNVPISESFSSRHHLQEEYQMESEVKTASENSNNGNEMMCMQVTSTGHIDGVVTENEGTLLSTQNGDAHYSDHEENDASGLPLWVKWRGKWRAGLQCSLIDCPLATLKGKPKHDRKSYVLVYYPNSRSHFWMDSQLACPISEKPEPLESGTHESGREMVKDPNTPRRFMMQRLAVSMLDASDRLHVEVVEESARDVKAWIEFAKEAAKCTTYPDLGRMLLKLHGMILDTFINPSWKETFHLWKDRCVNTRSAADTEKLKDELMDAIMWDDVAKLWDVPLNLSEEWKTWKKEVMKLFSTSNPSILSFEKYDKEDQIKTGDSFDATGLENSRKRQKLEVRRGCPSEGKNTADQVSPVEGSLSLSLVPSNDVYHPASNQIALRVINESEGLKDNSKIREYRHCSAFVEKKGRNCSQWAMDGELYCFKHSHSNTPERQMNTEKSVSTVTPETNALLCQGTTVHGNQCSHKARNGTHYCKKHMISDGQLTDGIQNSKCHGDNQKRARVTNEGPLSSCFGSNQKKARLSYNGQALEIETTLALPEPDSLLASRSQKTEGSSLHLDSLSKGLSKGWSRCYGSCRNRGGQCSHRAKPGTLYCEKHLPVSQSGNHIYNPMLLDGIFKSDLDEVLQPRQLVCGLVKRCLTEGGDYNRDNMNRELERVLGKEQNVDHLEELLKEVILQKERLVKHFNLIEEEGKAIVVSHENPASVKERVNNAAASSSTVSSQSFSFQFHCQECKPCKEKFSDFEAFSQHYLTIHKKEAESHFRGYACLQCTSSFTNKKGLERHVKIHHGHVSFEQCSMSCCIACELRLQSLDQLSEHVILTHFQDLSRLINSKHSSIAPERSSAMATDIDMPSSTGQQVGLELICVVPNENGERSVTIHGEDMDIDERRTFVRVGKKRYTCKYCGIKFHLLPDLGRHHQAKHKGSLAPGPNGTSSTKWKASNSNQKLSHSSLGYNLMSDADIKRRMKSFDIHGSTQIRYNSAEIENGDILGNFTDSHCAAIADMLLKGQKIRPWPNNLEILHAASKACCRDNFQLILEKKYGKLPERLYVKAVRNCSEENIRIEWHRDGYICPKGCKSVTEEDTPLLPLPKLCYGSFSDHMNALQVAINGYNYSSWDKTESHLVLNSCNYVKTRSPKRVILLDDLSFGQETVPIPCVVDEDIMSLCTCEMCKDIKYKLKDPAMPWKNFHYITKRLLDPSLGLDTESSQLGCVCTGRHCTPDSCDHVYLFDNDNEDAKDIYGNPMLGRFPYDENGRIILERGLLVYECNSLCSCNKECQNRVLQRGVQVKLEVFKTRHKGWAVRAAEPIRRGAFICEYSGEVLNDQEANKRGERYDKDGCSYLYDIDIHINAIDFMEDSRPYVIDATKYGNVARFINHSCAPNLVNYQVLVESMDCQLAHIGLYASRDIAFGEELAYDYHYKLLPGNGVQCQCGAENCRGRLY